MPLQTDHSTGRFVSEHSIEHGRNAYRAGHIGGHAEQRSTRTDQGALAARRATRRAPGIVRIERTAAQQIVRLPAGAELRCVADQQRNGAGRPQIGDGCAIGGGADTASLHGADAVGETCVSVDREWRGNTYLLRI